RLEGVRVTESERSDSVPSPYPVAAGCPRSRRPSSAVTSPSAPRSTVSPSTPRPRLARLRATLTGGATRLGEPFDERRGSALAATITCRNQVGDAVFVAERLFSGPLWAHVG